VILVRCDQPGCKREHALDMTRSVNLSKIHLFRIGWRTNRANTLIYCPVCSGVIPEAPR